MRSNASRDPFFDYIWFQQKRRPESPLTNAEPRRHCRKKIIFRNAAELGLGLRNEGFEELLCQRVGAAVRTG